jgi:hypothetical protein
VGAYSSGAQVMKDLTRKSLLAYSNQNKTNVQRPRADTAVKVFMVAVRERGKWGIRAERADFQ